MRYTGHPQQSAEKWKRSSGRVYACYENRIEHRPHRTGLDPALAVSLNIRGIDLTLVGWILTAVGALGLIFSLILSRRNRSIVPPAADRYDPYQSERTHATNLEASAATQIIS